MRLPHPSAPILVAPTTLRSLIFTALGVSLWGCSGQVECPDCDPGSGGSTDGQSASGGHTASGGHIASGGRTATGGRAATGGREGATGGQGQGGATGGAAGGEGTGGGSGGSASASCTNPEPVEGHPGTFRCDEGYLHRPVAGMCGSSLPRERTVSWPALPAGTGGVGGASDVGYTTSGDDCTEDADCAENAHCELVHTNGQPLSLCLDIDPRQPAVPDYARLCIAGCTTDEDCGPSEICECGDPIGSCVQTVVGAAGCRTDADCDGGAACLKNARSDNLSMHKWACELPGDTCSSDAGCNIGEFCAFSEQGRSCQGMAVCGRPFFVQGEARCAAATHTLSWLWTAAPEASREERRDARGVPTHAAVVSTETGEAAGSGPALRSALADHWTRVGLMEHASVAAFARFALQLLSLGAPAELLVGCARAQLDEARHAGLAFGLASQYRGNPIGPGPLPMHAALEDTSWEDILVGTIREGCIGETRAALEASRAAEGCEDAHVREVLLAIANDESQHAELAWRSVAWMLQQRPNLASVARLEFARAMVSIPVDPGRPWGARPQGVLDTLELMTCYQEANEQVVRPCAEALFAKLQISAATLESAPESVRAVRV